ncbi:MAG: integrase family protein [Candidatus Acidoferrum typicum]|nr:integrase family protein [Candidatus Acidoferrum typicum]
MRGVHQTKKGSDDWLIEYTDQDGKRHREHIGRKDVAEETLVDRRRQIRDGTLVPPAERRRQKIESQHTERHKREGFTFKEVFWRRLQAMQGKLSQGTLKNYKYKFGTKYFDVLREMPVHKIRREHIDLFLSALYADELGPNTIIGYRSLAGAVLAHAVSLDRIESNPVLKTHPPKQPKDRVRFLSADEEEAIRKQLCERWPERVPEFDLLLHTGMRVGELWHLSWERVHPDRGIIEAPKEGKTGWRDIPLNSTARSAIAELHANSRGSEFVVPQARSKRGKRYLARWVGQAAAKAGVIKVTPHTLRHTFASRLVMAGENLASVQELLGHSDVETTMIYVHLSPHHLQSAVEKLVAPPVNATETAKKPPVRARAATMPSAPAKRPPSRVRIATPDVVKVA